MYECLSGQNPLIQERMEVLNLTNKKIKYKINIILRTVLYLS